MFILHFGLILVSVTSSVLMAKERQPLTYQSCGATAHITKVPERAIAIDINMTEIMLSLGLSARMVAIAGVEDTKQIKTDLLADFRKIPAINTSYPSLESLMKFRPDFVFAGWQYGFSEASGLTPKRLAKHGVASHVLSESCIRVQPKPAHSFEDVYADIRVIGKIFAVEARAEAMIHSYQEQEKILQSQASRLKSHRIFLYDSGEASPFTAGLFAIPTTMIQRAGSRNIFEDVKASWTSVSWEDVIVRKPEFIIIVDYGDKNAEEKMRFLRSKLQNKGIPAMEQGHFLVMPYAAVTPGIRTLEATGQLIQALQKAFPAGRS